MNTTILRIQNRYLRLVIFNFSNDAFEAAEFWCIFGLTAILQLLQRKKSDFL